MATRKTKTANKRIAREAMRQARSGGQIPPAAKAGKKARPARPAAPAPAPKPATP